MVRWQVTLWLVVLLSVFYGQALSETLSETFSSKFEEFSSYSTMCSSESVESVTYNSSLCFQRITCMMPILNVSVLGDAALDFSVTQVNQSMFDVCSSGSSGIPSGTYQFLVAIAYSQTEDPVFVNVTLEVIEANAPLDIMVEGDSTAVSVYENVSPGDVVLRFNVADPNSQTNSPTTISVQLNGSDNILGVRELNNTFYEVVVMRTLNATNQSTYNLLITARNDCGVTSSVNVSISVRDVNEAPQCVHEVRVAINRTFLSGAIVGSITCWDWDLTYEFRQITYSPNSLFSLLQIADNGSIILSSQVLNDSVLGPTKVSVYARNYSEVNTTVTVLMVIGDYSGPNCTLLHNISFYETDANGTCSNDTVVCSPVYSGVHLTSTYSPARHFTAISSENNTSLSTRVCVVGTLLYNVGTYNLDLVVSEKGMTSVRLYIEVADVNQPPSFLRKEYVFIVAEDMQPMTVLVTVNVTEGPGPASLSADTDNIMVWDQDTFTDAFRFKQLIVTDFMVQMPSSSLFDKRNISWSPVQLSIINSTFGMFYLNTTPTPDVQYRFTLKAEDGSGLFDTVNVTFYVNDTNQAPFCHNSSVTIDLVTPVGTEVVTVSCADNDTTPLFSELVYRENNSSGNNDYFSINSTGTITLERALPVGVVNMTYSVYVQDGGGLSGSAVVNIQINSNYPPRCNMNQAIATFQETDPAGTCSPPVTCRDSANRSLPLNISVHGGLVQRSVVVNTTQLANDSVTLGLCIMQDVSRTAENFSIQVDVSSLLGVMSVTWNVSISDVNQAPYFRRSAYRLTVMENVPVGESLAVVRVATNISDTGGDADIVAFDPDLVTNDFKIQNIRLYLKLEYLNGTHLENLSPAPFELVNTSIRVVAPLKADFIYQLTFIAEDGKGLTGNVTLTITINDTNQSPECHPDSVLNLDLKSSVPKIVYTIQCFDPDIDPKFHSLTFGVHTELNYTFFDVTATTGEVILVKPVPRTARDLHVKVFASDGGGLTVNSTLNFTVSGNYTPICNPAYVPPDKEWTHGQCFRVEPHCSDPSTLDGSLSFLKYNFSGNFLSAFTVNESLENGTYTEFCYTMYTNGSYQVDLRVDNGLGTYLWSYLVTVMYLRAAPRFTETVYSGFANETAAAGDLVLRVRATINGTEGRVIYTLLDDSGGFGLFFEVDKQTGDIRVLANLTTKVETTISAHITAEDLTTGLNTTAAVNVKIKDVNQPPVCNSSIFSSIVPWNVAPKHVITRVACSDSDPTPSFSNITYLIVGDGVWDINSSSGDVFVKARGLLLPENTTFSFNVTVTDGVYNVTVLLNIRVNRTAPSPNATVTRVYPTSASVAWTFDPLYESVIQKFVVEIAHVNGTHLQSASLTHSARDYVVEQLIPLQKYNVVVVVVGIDTNSSSNSLQFTTQQAIIADTKLIFTEGLIIENDNVTFICTARTPGMNSTVFRWSLAGVELQNSSSNHLRLTTSNNGMFQFTSQLVISGIRLTEKGSLSCEVSNSFAKETLNISLEVVSAISVTLSASTQVVSPNDNVNFTCSRSAGYIDDWKAQLSCNNSINDAKNVTRTETKVIFPIIRVPETFSCTCTATDSQGFDKSKEETISVISQGKLTCPQDSNWPAAPAGATVSAECTNSNGKMRRKCTDTGKWETVDTMECVSADLQELNNTLRDMLDGVLVFNVSDIAHTLANSTQASEQLSQGDVTLTVHVMQRVIDSIKQDQGLDGIQLKSFAQTADNVMQASSDVWNKLESEAFKLFRAMDMMGQAAAAHLDNITETTTHIKTRNIMLQVGRASSGILFPNRSIPQNYSDWVIQAKNSIILPQAAVPSDSGTRYSALIYRNLSNIFPQDSSSSVGKTTSEQKIDSVILTMTLVNITKLLEPVTLIFEHQSNNTSNTSCQFIDFSNSSSARWSEEGCRVLESNTSITTCSCDHLTNFAILMSPYRPNDIHAKILSYITYIGCGISILGLFLTIIVYAALWKYVKSDRSVILVNLCVVLMLAYITFLSGVRPTGNKEACTTVTVLLHYLFLVVFFLMLSEGLNIFIAIVIVFPTKSILVWLLCLAYGAPLIIVAVSLGVRFDGYGNDEFCWLSLEDGLIWAFIGPALATLLANFVVVAVVIRALVSSTTFITKSNREKAKSVVKAICVMTPVLGLTWIFSVFSVNKETVVFQYIFLAFNSLQGLLIFIIYCVLSKQVREGLQHKRRRYLASSSSNDRTSSNKPTSESSSSNDYEITQSSFSRPERHVHQRSSKISGVDNTLTFNKPSPFDVSKSAVVPFGSESTHESEKYTYIKYQRDEETGQFEGITEFRSQIRELTKNQMPPERYEPGKSNKGQAPVPQVPDFSSSVNKETSETKHGSQARDMWRFGVRAVLDSAAQSFTPRDKSHEYTSLQPFRLDRSEDWRDKKVPPQTAPKPGRLEEPAIDYS